MSLSPIRALTLEVPESIDLRQAARYLGAPGEPGSGTLALLERCAPPLLHAAMPKAVWRTADTAAWDEAGILQGADIRRHLTECPQAILLAVTLGPMVDSQIRRAAVGDVAAGAAADALASALAEQSADQAEALLRQTITAEGRYLTCRYSPGYGDWPVTVQPQAAELLDAGRQIGLYVTDTALMTPRKSVTALLGVSRRPVTGHLAGCGHCALRDRCEYRKRGKTCASQ